MLRRVDAREDRHEVQGGIVDEVEEHVDVALRGVQAQELRTAQGIDRICETAREQHRDHRGHAARHVTDDVLQDLHGRKLLLADKLDVGGGSLGVLNRLELVDVGK